MKIGRIQRRAVTGERLSGAAPARLAMDVLGGLGLSVGERRLPLESKKGRAMLAFLALDGRGAATRERLTTLFWPDASEDRAGGSFRQALNDIDRALAACGCAALERLPGAIQLDCGMIDLDLDAMLAAIGRGAVPAQLEKAGSCAERLLDGYETMPADFQEWMEGQRRVTHERLLRALEVGYEGEGLPTAARRRLAEAALRMDPLHEAACRTVMRLAAEAGEYGPALKAYEALYEAMGVDLDMEPSEATQALVARIKQGQVEAVSLRGVAAAPSTVAAAPSAAGGRPTIAVLPFRLLGGTALASHLGDGLVADIVCQLSGLRELRVISHGSTAGLREAGDDPRGIGRALGARYVVRGMVRASSEGLRLTTELADAESGIVVNARAQDGPATPSFVEQDRIVAQIVNALAPHVQGAELRRIRGRRPESLDAYEKTLLVRQLLQAQDEGGFEQARGLLDAALAEDPDYGEAYALAADWHGLRLAQSLAGDRVVALAEAERLGRAALARDPDNLRALVRLGHRRMLHHRDYEGALGLFGRALTAAPHSAQAWLWSSHTYSYMGEAEEAVRRAEMALALSPQDAEAHFFLGALCLGHYVLGDYEGARFWGVRSMALSTPSPTYRPFLLAALGALGDAAQARPLVAAIAAARPRFGAVALGRRMPFRDQGMNVRITEHMMAAGLPA